MSRDKEKDRKKAQEKLRVNRQKEKRHQSYNSLSLRYGHQKKTSEYMIGKGQAGLRVSCVS
jgi:hypothetical protein